MICAARTRLGLTLSALCTLVPGDGSHSPVLPQSPDMHTCLDRPHRAAGEGCPADAAAYPAVVLATAAGWAILSCQGVLLVLTFNLTSHDAHHDAGFDSTHLVPPPILGPD